MCCWAFGGVIRVAGSQSRQRPTKSTSCMSSQLSRAEWSDRDAGTPRILPRRDLPAVSLLWLLTLAPPQYLHQSNKQTVYTSISCYTVCCSKRPSHELASHKTINITNTGLCSPYAIHSFKPICLNATSGKLAFPATGRKYCGKMDESKLDWIQQDLCIVVTDVALMHADDTGENIHCEPQKSLHSRS